jgi:hypothetical protein
METESHALTIQSKKGGLMTPLDLSSEEQTTLIRILNEYISDLGMEIADTDNKDFREELKKRKEMVRTILGKLQ